MKLSPGQAFSSSLRICGSRAKGLSPCSGVPGALARWRSGARPRRDGEEGTRGMGVGVLSCCFSARGVGVGGGGVRCGPTDIEVENRLSAI